MTKKAIDKKGQAGPSAEKARLNSDSRVGLLGLILSDRKFVAALVGGVAVIGAMAVSLPKVWVITPKNFVPVIRISLLDMVQARMLGKSARKLGAEGRRKEAVIAWAGALGNHPAHRENLRGFVEYTLTEEGLEHRWLMIGAQQAQWLATLSGTNDASNVELAGRMLTRAGFDEQAWGFLQTTNRSLSLPAARALAEVAFKTGRLKEFVDVWERYQADLERDPGLTLYRSAWMAVAGPPGEQAASMAAIEAATKSPVLAVTAFRLRSMVEAMRLDVDGFQRSFEELRALRVDTLDDHIRSWLVLDAAGEHALAVAKATAYAVPPETVSQARQMLVAWTRLRLENLAVGFARNQLDAFPYDPEVWFLTSQMLVTARQWDELRGVALRLRRNTTLSGFFAGYLDFMEGTSENGNGRIDRARELFAVMLKRMPAEPVLGLDASRMLERLGYRMEAQTVLRSLETVFGGRADYWFSMGRLAWQSRDSDALLAAAERAYRLEPSNVEYVNHYAAALLISRVRPAEAVQLTLQVLKDSQYAHAAIINHSFALGRVGRIPEARKLLDELPISALTDEERTFWRMSMVEIELAEGNRAAAKVHLRGIDPQYLYSSQTEWLSATRKELDGAKP